MPKTEVLKEIPITGAHPCVGCKHYRPVRVVTLEDGHAVEQDVYCHSESAMDAGFSCREEGSAATRRGPRIADEKREKLRAKWRRKAARRRERKKAAAQKAAKPKAAKPETDAERKAKKAAYMREWYAKNKAKKTPAAATPEPAQRSKKPPRKLTPEEAACSHRGKRCTQPKLCTCDCDPCTEAQEIAKGAA